MQTLVIIRLNITFDNLPGLLEISQRGDPDAFGLQALLEPLDLAVALGMFPPGSVNGPPPDPEDTSGTLSRCPGARCRK